MAGSSTGSMGSIGSINICDCGKRAAMYTSWSLKNPGRRFFTCSEKALRCEYFQWFNQEVDGRNGDIITHLNNRRIFLEEKIKLLEERIAYWKEKLLRRRAKTEPWRRL
ncbi:hypothetical protein DCAR_0831146 [Daucus carota subsp. sativus]|uniref:GRF-type domain-containing protein n=1 Tax=Daucus carota subsp. sativus TaxID=79200 RepID=A0AAF0XS48_DAUCS|nr:hypothetical protein DCAR_0831146 [Daucus carota subsp. sativus]